MDASDEQISSPTRSQSAASPIRQIPKSYAPTSPYRIDIPKTPSSIHRRVNSSSSMRERQNYTSSPAMSEVIDEESISAFHKLHHDMMETSINSLVSPVATLGASPPGDCDKPESASTSDCDSPNPALSESADEPKGRNSSSVNHDEQNDKENVVSEDGAGDGDNDPKNKKRGRHEFDTTIELEKPFPKQIRALLEVTELPFMIMWVYLTYWVVIVALCAHKVKNTVWISAAVASLLVGVGLNANAYRMIIAKGRIDYGVIIRFFLIPFGVSTLSGMTNSLREDFLLVFPRDPWELVFSICLPAIVVSLIVVLRVTLLWKLRVKLTVRSLLLNGTLATKQVYY